MKTWFLINVLRLSICANGYDDFQIFQYLKKLKSIKWMNNRKLIGFICFFLVYEGYQNGTKVSEGALMEWAY